MEKRNIIKNQEGFTLIEIISVLVILGILAAVAVPKFIDLQADAKINTVRGALASGKSTITQAYAKAMLTASGLPTTDEVITAIKDVNGGTNATGVVLGDFTADFEAVAASGTGETAVSAGIKVTIKTDANGDDPANYDGVDDSDFIDTVVLDFKSA